MRECGFRHPQRRFDRGKTISGLRIFRITRHSKRFLHQAIREKDSSSFIITELLSYAAQCGSVRNRAPERTATVDIGRDKIGIKLFRCLEVSGEEFNLRDDLVSLAKLAAIVMRESPNLACS